MKNVFLLSCALALLIGQANAQRYVSKVFTGVTRTANVVYGRNITVINASLGQTFTEQDLKMDVYEPTGDTASKRPLVIVTHSGNFLPAVINNSATGGYPSLTIGAIGCDGKTDSAVVAICRDFAMRGYVAVAMNYRLGWNPVSTADSVRRSTLLQAAFRGVQDMRTAVRYMRKDFASSNMYKIDTSKIIVGGIGTGGYVALGTAYLNDPLTEIYQVQKFQFSSGQPYVVVSAPGKRGFGGIGGEDTSYFDAGNTVKLNLGNHKGYSNKVHMVFHLGGAMGDTTWMDAGEPAIVGIQLPEDPYAPYNLGNVFVPGIPLPIIPDASGAGSNLTRATALNLNAGFGMGLSDPYTMRANAINGGREGLFPLLGITKSDSIDCDADIATPKNPGDFNSGPWNWYNEPVFQAYWAGIPGSAAYAATGPIANCRQRNGMRSSTGTFNDPAFAKTYVDTAVSYIAPRAARLFQLYTNLDADYLRSTVSLFPNPAATAFMVRCNNAGNPVVSVALYDLTGRLVREVAATNNEVVIERNELANGLYVARIIFAEGAVSQKVKFE